jgi:hypothetical protein
MNMSKLSIIGILIIIVLVFIVVQRKSHLFGSALMPDGKFVTEAHTVGDFTKLKLNGVFKTIITQDGGPVWVKVETDQNLQQTVEMKNDGDELMIGSKEGFSFSTPTKMVVYVNVKDIHSITNKSVGNIESKGTLKTQELYLKNSAVGKTILHIDVQKLTAELDAVGATILTGSATEATLDNSSVGKLAAYDLRTDILSIDNNAVGSVEVDAEKEISINHKGVGSLHYKGAAKVKSLKDDGVGKVTKAD